MQVQMDIANPATAWTNPLSSRVVSMLLRLPFRICDARACHSTSACATFSRYFVPIHRLEVLPEAVDARKAHLAHMETSERVELRNKVGDAIINMMHIILLIIINII